MQPVKPAAVWQVKVTEVTRRRKIFKRAGRTPAENVWLHSIKEKKKNTGHMIFADVFSVTQCMLVTRLVGECRSGQVSEILFEVFQFLLQIMIWKQNSILYKQPSNFILTEGKKNFLQNPPCMSVCVRVCVKCELEKLSFTRGPNGKKYQLWSYYKYE